jgi:predicted transcriptional regulator
VSLDDATHAGLDTLSEALKLPVSRVIDQLVEAELKRRARRATT